MDGKEEQLDLLTSEGRSCPSCGCQLVIRTSISNRSARRFTFQEFYSAVNGLGLPNETVTHKEPVIAMLLAHRVVAVEAREIDERCIIDSITLDNGVTFHMAASGYGAAVYKAIRRKPDASLWTEHELYQQYLRGHSSPKKHRTRGARDANPGCEVHGRLREDADAVGGDDRRTTIPSSPRREREGESRSELAGEADSREDGRSAAPQEEDQEAEGQGGSSGG